jgi:hypothetical protein
VSEHANMRPHGSQAISRTSYTPQRPWHARRGRRRRCRDKRKGRRARTEGELTVRLLAAGKQSFRDEHEQHTGLPPTMVEMRSDRHIRQLRQILASRKRDQMCRGRRGKEGGPHQEASEHIDGGGGAQRRPELAEVCGGRRCKSRA